MVSRNLKKLTKPSFFAPKREVAQGDIRRVSSRFVAFIQYFSCFVFGERAALESRSDFSYVAAVYFFSF